MINSIVSHKHKAGVLTVLLFFLCSLSFSQSIDPKKAKNYFDNGNYIQAAQSYAKLVEKDPFNDEYLYKAGYSYLNCNLDRTKALYYLEELYKIIPEQPEVQFQLAIAYYFNLKLKKALDLFGKYKSNAPPERIELVDQYMKNCYTAVELILEPENVTFENLGPLINTEFPDYYPFVAKDGSFLVYTSRRKGNVGGAGIEFDGYYSSDIWVATNVNGKFTKARNAGAMINSEFDDQAVGLSDDGKTLFVYADKLKDFGDIYTAHREVKSFKPPVKLGENVNSQSLESAASISADENTLFFASDRPNGHGGLDLYMTRKLPNGKWALPQNLGDKINTSFDEDFPTLSADGKTLYFCSEGHENIGGFDIFKSIWNSEDNSWSTPKNMGFPINSPQDERVISFTEDGIHAYISSARKGGLGDLDIYRITFHENLPKVLIFLTVKDQAGSILTDAFVNINDEHDELVGDYIANEKTKKYPMILSKGKYFLHIDSDGKKYHVEEINIDVDAIKKGIMEKEIVLENQ